MRRGFCSGPPEGSVEDFTLRDIPLYARKLLLGPIDPGLPSSFRRQPLPTAVSRSDVVRLTLVGDIMFWRRMPRDACGLYARLPRALRETDLTLANLEFPVSPSSRASGFPRYNGTTAYFKRVVTPLGARALSVANNHCLDQGPRGLMSTLELLEAEGVTALGASTDGQPFRVLDAAGRRVALTAYTYSTNGRPLPKTPRVHRLRLNAWSPEGRGEAELLEVVRAMRGSADVVVLSLHWGFEYERSPRSSQVALAHTLMDAGVDVIAGHHPHVLQPAESYRASDGRTCLCAYSLGNWTTAMLPRYARVTAAVRVHMAPGIGCVALDAYPLYFSRQGPTFRPLEGHLPLSLRRLVPASLRRRSVPPIEPRGDRFPNERQLGHGHLGDHDRRADCSQ